MGEIMFNKGRHIKGRFPTCKKCGYVHINRRKTCPKRTSKNPVNRAMTRTRKDIDQELDSVDWAAPR